MRPVGRRWLTALYYSARKNARARGLEWALSPADFDALYDRTGGQCSLTGLPFDFSPCASPGEKRPLYPSLDRIDSARGYVIDNCRFVCVAANLALHEWGEAMFRRLVIGYFQHNNLGKILRRGDLTEVLPDNVRVYRGKKGLRYHARIRLPDGRARSAGSFATAAEAVAAQAAWYAEHPLYVNRHLQDTLLKDASASKEKAAESLGKSAA